MMRALLLAACCLLAATARADDDVEPCRVVAAAINAGRLGALSVPPRTPRLDKDALPPALRDALWVSVFDSWRLDVDGDGLPDDIVLSSEGTAHVGGFNVLPGRRGTKVASLAQIDEPDLSMLRVAGRYLFLSANGSTPAHLWRVRSDGAFQWMCGFRRRPSPILQLTEGGGKPLCAALLAGRLPQVPFNAKHTVAALPEEQRFWSKSPLPGLAKADIDGDGRPDNVLRVRFDNGAGRGCDTTLLAVADADAASIPDSPANRILWDDLSGPVCGPEQTLVQFDRKAYVQTSWDQASRALYRLEQGKAVLECKVEGRWQYDGVAGTPPHRF